MSTWKCSLFLALLSGVGAAVANPAKVPTIVIDGSSTVYPVTEAVAEEFQNSKKDKSGKPTIQVTVGTSGTGGGFKKFCRGQTDIQDASRPILAGKPATDGKKAEPGEMEQCNAAGIAYIELPIAFDAITVVVNPKATWVSEMNVEELKKIWQPPEPGAEKITKWNQIRGSWPDAPIKLYGAGADSGTFDYFTEAIVGKAKASRGDFTASEDDNILVQGIKNDVHALGFIPYAYYEANKKSLKALAIHGGDKSPTKKAVAPTPATVEDGSYYPLSRPIFIYVSAKSLATRPEVKEFVEFYLANVGTLAKQVGYVPLPAQAYSLASTHLKNGRQGTVFGGHPEVGLKIEELLKREAVVEAKAAGAAPKAKR